MAKQGWPRLILYKNPASPPSCAVMILGDILGLTFDYKEPELRKREHKSAEFKKINPMGTIPVLQDDDFIVSESHAIMKYLLNKYGGALQEKLYPSEPRQQAKVDQCLFFEAGVLFPRLKAVALPSFFHGLAGPTSQHLEDIEEAYSVVEAYLNGDRYIAGDRITIADLSLGTTISAAEAILELDKKKFPLSVAWLSRLQEEDCFKEINNPGAALFTKLLHMSWQKNKN
ncbi:glutathione S-transferase 1-like [Pararge aegeria]|uniref:glutathione S-transferase 1-like n=1 Tax=Pararge aegeria TaxID=116150 RepID=UPI0019D0E433|nr:glutathione S-transferase 1-like [Pararge aegeria]